jgi:hypothetical protein
LQDFVNDSPDRLVRTLSSERRGPQHGLKVATKLGVEKLQDSMHYEGYQASRKIDFPQTRPLLADPEDEKTNGDKAFALHSFDLRCMAFIRCIRPKKFPRSQTRGPSAASAEIRLGWRRRLYLGGEHDDEALRD